jgi:hypothetical protein
VTNNDVDLDWNLDLFTLITSHNKLQPLQNSFFASTDISLKSASSTAFA